MGILDRLAAQQQHNNIIHQLVHLNLFSNQMQATCQYVTEWSNSMPLACSRPLPQARGGTGPAQWPFGGLGCSRPLHGGQAGGLPHGILPHTHDPLPHTGLAMGSRVGP